jgi:predicted N-formylglutamate amidohydrolase
MNGQTKPLGPLFNTGGGPEKPYECQPGESAVIFIGPHNSNDVPAWLYDSHGLPLGMTEDDMKSHHAWDIGMQDLFKGLMPAAPQHNYFWSTVSRAAIEHNYKEEFCIIPNFREFKKIIPGNRISGEEHRERVERLHKPYFDALDALIKKVIDRHGGAILMDMHSCTPVWAENGITKDRDAGVGTCNFETTPLEEALNDFLAGSCAERGLLYTPDKPYKIKPDANGKKPVHPRGGKELVIEDMLVPKFLCARHRVYMMSLEIRNDYLSNSQTRQAVQQIIQGAVDYLERHPDYESFLRRDAAHSLKPDQDLDSPFSLTAAL